MDESVETARAARADDRTSKASKKEAMGSPLIQSHIWMEEIWVGSLDMSKDSK